MINSIVVKSGYALEIPRLKRIVEFTPGLNILFGENGCGKTTVIKIASAGCSIKEGGWSHSPSPLDLRDTDGRIEKVFEQWSPGKCKAEVKWDGSPTIMHDPSLTDQRKFSYFFDKEEESPDRLMTMKDQLVAMKSKHSAGQYRISKLLQYITEFKNPPDLSKPIYTDCNDIWQKAGEMLSKYIAKLPRNGPISILMDEPERSLSIPNQYDLWYTVIPDLAKKYQIIVATHSPFAVLSNANFIEFEEGYVDKVKKIVKKIC